MMHDKSHLFDGHHKFHVLRGIRMNPSIQTLPSHPVLPSTPILEHIHTYVRSVLNERPPYFGARCRALQGGIRDDNHGDDDDDDGFVLSDPLLAPYIFFTLKGINRCTDTSWLKADICMAFPCPTDCGCDTEPSRIDRLCARSSTCVCVRDEHPPSITGSQINSEKVRMFRCPELLHADTNRLRGANYGA